MTTRANLALSKLVTSQHHVIRVKHDTLERNETQITRPSTNNLSQDYAQSVVTIHVFGEAEQNNQSPVNNLHRYVKSKSDDNTHSLSEPVQKLVTSQHIDYTLPKQTSKFTLNSFNLKLNRKLQPVNNLTKTVQSD